MADFNSSSDGYIDVSSLTNLSSFPTLDQGIDSIIGTASSYIKDGDGLIIPNANGKGLWYSNFMDNCFGTKGDVAIVKNDADGLWYYASVKKGQINIDDAKRVDQIEIPEGKENEKLAKQLVDAAVSNQDPKASLSNPKSDTTLVPESEEDSSNPVDTPKTESTSSPEPKDETSELDEQTPSTLALDDDKMNNFRDLFQPNNVVSFFNSVIESISKFIDTSVKKYDSVDARKLKNDLNGIFYNTLIQISDSIPNLLGVFSLLNFKTLEKLNSIKITVDILDEKLNLYCDEWKKSLNLIIENISETEKDTSGEDEKTPEKDINPYTPPIHITPPKDPNIDNNPPKNDDNPPVEEIKPPLPTEVPSIIIASVIGTFTVKEIVTMYEAIGNPTGIPASLTGNYVVLGILKSDDKYYYKVVDKDANKVYYIEVTNKVEFKAEVQNVLEIKSPTMMLNSTDIGTNNFVKKADQNTLYIVVNETESNDIKFYNVLDPVDGKAYFIPASDEVQLVSLDSITSNDKNTQISQENGGDII